jgi:hypothetical protein
MSATTAPATNAYRVLRQAATEYMDTAVSRKIGPYG